MKSTCCTWNPEGTQKLSSITVLTLLVPEALALSGMSYSAASKALREQNRSYDSSFLLPFSLPPIIYTITHFSSFFFFLFFKVQFSPVIWYRPDFELLFVLDVWKDMRVFVCDRKRKRGYTWKDITHLLPSLPDKIFSLLSPILNITISKNVFRSLQHMWSLTSHFLSPT